MYWEGPLLGGFLQQNQAQILTHPLVHSLTHSVSQS